jgi:hypothetical protein
MARRPGTRWWRWRRNPLRRRSDVVEAWVLLAACVLAVLGGAVAGWLTAGAMRGGFEQARTDTRAVTAVLTEKARPQAADRPGGGNDAWATVRWRAADGIPHTARSEVPVGTPAGTRVTVWVDRHGTPTSRPPSPGQATVQAALGGLWAATAAAGAVYGGTRLVRARLDRRRMAQWAAEWEQVGARWGRQTN